MRCREPPNVPYANIVAVTLAEPPWLALSLTSAHHRSLNRRNIQNSDCHHHITILLMIPLELVASDSTSGSLLVAIMSKLQIRCYRHTTLRHLDDFPLNMFAHLAS